MNLCGLFRSGVNWRRVARILSTALLEHQSLDQKVAQLFA
jgi:hypothetical protein